jgi:hypothetical protein
VAVGRLDATVQDVEIWRRPWHFWSLASLSVALRAGRTDVPKTLKGGL